MKKIITVFLLLFLIFPIHLYAQTDFSNWTTTLPQDKSNLVIESETRYKWFKEKQINISYDLLNESNREFVDINDYKYSEIMQSVTKPEQKPDRIISTSKTKIIYDKSLVKYISLFGFDINERLTITEITLKNKKTNEIIDYSVEECHMCDGYSDNLNNNDKNGFAMYISPFVNILINLKEFSNLEDIQIFIYYINDGIEINTFSIGYSHFSDNTFSNHGYDKNSYSLNCNEICELTTISSNIKIDYFAERLYDVYVYRDKLYKHYDIYKEYLPDYFVNVEDYQKDESTAITFYRYKHKNLNKIVENITYKTIELPQEVNELSVEPINEQTISPTNEENTNKKIAISNNNPTKTRNVYLLYAEIFVTLSIISTLFYFICKFIYKKKK